MNEHIRTYCGLCHLRCGLLFEMENGKAVRVKWDPDHPVTRGKVCSSGLLMIDHLYHPNLINYPLKRKGGRGTEPALFGVFESNINVLCPDDAEYCNPKIGGWPHTALLCRIEKAGEKKQRAKSKGHGGGGALRLRAATLEERFA